MPGAVEYLISSQPEFRKARLPSLYSDFRAQNGSNPDGYQANVRAWESGIASAAKAGLLGIDRLSVRFGPKLGQLLMSQEYGQPQGLKIVEEENVLSGHFLPFYEFLHSTRNIYDRSWDMNPTQLPINALTWVLRQAGLTDRVRVDPDQHYVLVGNLEELGERLSTELAQKKRHVDRVMPMTEFRYFVLEHLFLTSLSDIDFAIILKWLSRDKNKIAYNESMVKVKALTDDAVKISQEDEQIAAVKAIISDIKSQVESVSKKIEVRTLEIKEFLARKNRISALASLKSRKLLEQVLAKRGHTLIQLEEALNKIEEASDQVETVKAMQGSTEVLRMLSREIGGANNVERVLDELHGEIDKVDEVNDVINDHTQMMSSIDDDSIDYELAQLEAESKASKEEATNVEKRLEELNGRETLQQSEKTNYPDEAQAEPILSN